MAHQVQGVVAETRGAPVKLTTINVPDPGPGEALVRVQACGVCHTDLHYREGAINDDFPFLLGHEAAGVVESVGPDVDNVAPGDFVILAWRAPCGTCRSCVRGRPWYCFDSRNATQPMTLADGKPLSPALGIGAFTELTLVAAGQAVKVPAEASPAAAGLIGCGIMAGLGAAVNTGGVSRGDSVAVFGCGGVAATPPSPGQSWQEPTLSSPLTLTTASWNGPATSVPLTTINARNTDPVEAVRNLTGGNGVNVAIEAVGNPVTFEQAFYARDHAGTVVLVGVPSPDMKIELPLIEVFGRGGAVRSSWYGDCLPSRDFPMFIELYMQGRLDLDRFVSETIDIGDVEEAFHKMERGEVLRSVVVF